jgi:hypothetical protein
VRAGITGMFKKDSDSGLAGIFKKSFIKLSGKKEEEKASTPVFTQQQVRYMFRTKALWMDAYTSQPSFCMYAHVWMDA